MQTLCGRWRRVFAPALLIVTAPLAQAQVAPDAGGTQRQQQPPVLELPRAPPPPLQTEQPPPPVLNAPADIRFVLRDVRITGGTAFPEGELLNLVQDLVGKTVGLADLEQAAARVSRYYREHGYVVARAYLPAQDIQNGVVEIAVLEGRLGRVIIENGSRVRDGVIASRVEGLQGRIVRDEDIDARLRLTYELPGVGTGSQAALRPGANVGEADLVLQLDADPLISGFVAVDNYGNRFTGGNRLSGSVDFNSPTRSGDLLSLRAVLGEPELRVYEASYQVPVGPSGLLIGADYSHVGYELGRDFSVLDATGTADTWLAFASHPVLGGRTYSARARVSYQESDIQDLIGATSTVVDKSSRVGMLALIGDWRDAILGGGASAVSLSCALGDLDIESPDARAIDAATARSQGSFHRWNVNVMRLQYLTERASLLLSFTGQKASKNLDSSEKLFLGGVYGVRAYPVGEAPGDTGYLLNAELRYDVEAEWMPGRLQLLAFLDAGEVATNENQFALGSNRRDLSAAGVGVNFASAWGMDLRAVVAHKLGGARATSDTDQELRGWLQVAQRF